MANETYTLIQKTTLNASAASITFSSIPQTFTDLVIKLSLKTTRTTDYVDDFRLTFNGSSTGYSFKGFANYNGTVRSDQNASASYIYANAATASHASQTPNTFCNSEIYVPNYTSANNKSVSIDSTTEQNGTQIWQDLQAALWSNSAAINSITLVPDVAANFVQYSEVSLYGVAKLGVNPVAGPKASGGDIITNDGTYWIHQFLNSGTFTPSQTLSTEYLVIAGGGSGGTGGGNGGGGGAGGYKTSASFSVTGGTAYTVTIGAGGPAISNRANGSSAQNGTNSVFSTITSTGGGAGGSETINSGAGYNGGSGGGGAFNSYTGGTASPSGQGNNGGSGVTSPDYGSGGGGGAGAVGGTGTTTTGGAGGIGLSNSITGVATYYAGGGGGAVNRNAAGAGGLGGGGNAGYNTAGSNATINTGGGGGATNANTTTGAGGSGIVIIRYAI